ncbi:MAG: ABC transporter ATP-binding protein [Saprospiraceae bacterium]
MLKKESIPLLKVNDLQTTFYGDSETVVAVDGISFTLNKGETLGIVGESGSGKSVTSLSIMRLVPDPPGKITNGDILFSENDEQTTNLLELSESEMQKYRGNRIAMIFQEPMTSLNPVYTCGNQIVEAIVLHQKKSKKEAAILSKQLFEKVKLPNPDRIFNAYPHQLSGGQKQRVMIAMAMSCNPDILIADEPTTALDVTVQKAILDLMNEMKRDSGASVIFITHDLGVVGEIADRVLVMYKGKIVEQGPVEDIFLRPQHPYTKGLLACRPPLKYRLRKLPVIGDFMNSDGEATGTIASVQKAYEDLKISSLETDQRLAKLKTSEPLLKVSNLKTWFPVSKNFFGKPTEYVKAVDDVSFEVYKGETLGLVGESGCGKTTLGRSILRLNPVNSGQVSYDGKDILNLPEKEMRAMRKEMQIIFQDPYSSLNPRMGIGYAIQEPMEVHRLFQSKKERQERVIALLELVGLQPDHYHRYPHEFSGGQRQRVCIARALALDPSFIICDESVSALDVSVQAQVLNLLVELRERLDLTYIFISHDLSVVKYMSDRMMVMNKGKIEEIGPADEIYNNPSTKYTQRLIDAIPSGIIA